MKVLAIFGKRQRPLLNVEATRVSLMESFLREFHLDEDDAEKFLIQKWDKDFQEYLDLVDCSFLEDLDKLRFLKEDEPEPSNPQRSVLEDTSTNGDISDDEEDDVPIRHKLGGKAVPASYKLPPLELPLRQQLQTKQLLSPLWRKKLIRALYLDMVGTYVTDMYPTPLEYSRVVDALLRQYPHLADQPIAGLKWANVSDQGFTWRDSLRSKFKFERRKIDIEQNKNMKHVEDARSRYRHKTEGAEKPPSVWANGFVRAPPRALGCKVSELPEFGEGETAATTRQSVDQINQEWAKQKPDLALIEKRMARTRVNRMFLCTQWSVKQIQREYKPLEDAAQWVLEVRRQFNTDMSENRRSFFTPPVIRNALNVLATKPKAHAEATRIIDAHPHDEVEGQIAAILACLPWICNDVMKYWILTRDPVSSSNPTIHVKPGTQPNPYIGASYVPYLDGVSLCTDENLTLLEAIEILAGVMYLMNTKYLQQCFNSWRILCEVVHGLPATDAVKASIQKILARLYESQP